MTYGEHTTNGGAPEGWPTTLTAYYWPNPATPCALAGGVLVTADMAPFEQGRPAWACYLGCTCATCYHWAQLTVTAYARLVLSTG